MLTVFPKNLWLSCTSPDWPECWEHLADALKAEGHHTNFADCSRQTGECWEYMGTWFSDKLSITRSGQKQTVRCWQHQFRHRDFKGQRRYVNVACDPLPRDAA